MIHIVSTFIADVLGDPLKILLQKFCDQQIGFHYNQIFQQALLPHSECNKNKEGLNVILIRMSDLFNPAKEKTQSLDDLIIAINSLQKNMQVPLLIWLTPTQTTTIEEKNYYLNLENNLKSAVETDNNTRCLTSETIQTYPRNASVFDNFTEKYGHIPYTLEFYELLALFIARTYFLFTSKPYKVIVLDCDGTLWNGIIEEDGLNGITIDDEFLAIQQFMISLFQAGFLLCLCSKNKEQSVLNVFRRHPNMALDIDKHICSHRINWLPKSVNLQSLAQELKLGLDSFIFIDDNNVECAEVKAALPEVLVIELPPIQAKRGNAISRQHYLNHIWAFDLHGKSSEDEKRTVFYKQNKLRERLKSKSISYEHFLKKLEIKTQIRQANAHDLDRIIQLSQRTNQFNLFPQAVSAIEFNERILQQHPPGCLVIEASDKYGDYGLVGVVVYDVTADVLQIKSFFLSCRILGRGIEYTVIHHLTGIAEKHHVKNIKVLYKITEKNIPGMGFIQHVSGETNLPPIDHIVLPLDSIKKITPKLMHHTEKKKNQKNPQPTISNDFMLDIAKHYAQQKSNTPQPLNKKAISSSYNELTTVEISLLELLRQNALWAKNKNLSFIELGIDSLKSVLIASTIYQRFHVEISPFELLKHDFTIQKLTHYLLHQIKSDNDSKFELPRVDTQAVPLSYTQKRLWEDEKIFSGTSRNNMFAAYEIDGNVDADIMKDAFIQLMARHDALRCSFFEKESSPLQKINALQSIHFNINAYSSENDEEIKRYVTQFHQEPFDLFQAPLFRISLVKKEENKTIFLFCIHHIIHDGWSLNILLQELSEIYNAYSKQIPLSCVIDSSSYIQFILWQQHHIDEKLLETQRAFWKKQLSHMPRLELIYDKTRQMDHEKAVNHRVTFKLNSKITRQLKTCAINNQVTLYDVLISAFGLFLSHYANQKDINFITAVSGRHHAQAGYVIGFFVNLVLIRMQIDSQESFGDLTKKNQKTIHQIFENQDLPFNEIIQLAGESVNSKMHAFNQAAFIFQSYPINNPSINDKKCKRVFADDTAELIYDACDECRFGSLVCFMQAYDAELHGVFEYNTQLFDSKRIKYMLDAFKTLLKYIAEGHNKPTYAIPLVSANQYNLMMNKWNQPKVFYPNEVSVLGYFAEQVITQEHATAVIHNEHHLTYGELDKMSNQLARKLGKEGVGYETPVGIFLDQNLTRIVAMLGILKAGGCYIPFEIDVPIYRINYIMQDAGISLVITDHETEPYIKAHFSPIKTVLVTDHSIQSESNVPCPHTTNPNQLAYIMYTSGSTGNPKGVGVEQRGILRLVKSPNFIEINASDNIAQVSNFLFDAATFEIWGALLNGATVVLIDKNILLDTKLLNNIIKKNKISILFLTTQLFHTYSALSPDLFQNLNYMIFGGEAVLPEAVERVFNQKNRPRHLINAYGPTENTTFTTTYLIKNHVNLFNSVPIGKPISGTQVYVLDHALNPRPIGAPGTLYVGGTGLARGYLNHEQLNQEKYIDYLNQKLYDTGDIVAWQSDGNLKFLGRKDNKVKINGYAIELDEIEVQLKTHPLVMQAIVLVKNKNHHRQLVVYVLLKQGNDLRDINLYHHLKTMLPHYMLPTFYYQINRIPLTDNGKVDKKLLLKKKLPAISYKEYQPPANILQENLISIYAELLHIPPTEISINAEFFDLGGNSITALHLIDRVNAQFNVKINFSTLLECAHVQSLSKKIHDVLSDAPGSSVIDYSKYHNNALKTIKLGNPQKTPIVFIHPIGGSGFCYLGLIKLLLNDQPCYLIQDPSIDANQVLFEDMATMASCYNDLLLKAFGNRKIILAGYSFGGMLAMEMVSQLERQNLDDSIDFIIAFDTWVVSDMMNAEAKEALKLSIIAQYERVASNLLREHIDPKPWMELYYRRLQDIGFNYKPPQINKKILLFKAENQSGEFTSLQDATNFLKNYTAQGVDIHLISGNHDTILQYPQVWDIGRLMSEYLKEAQRK